MMDYSINRQVRISDEAFPGSDEPADIAARGQLATVTGNLVDMFGMDETECIVATTSDGVDHLLLLSELRFLPQ